jgi:SAM-dependent methyltransferase
MSLAAIAPWRDALARWLGSAAGRRPVLDAGAGTGQFARAFVAWFGRRVVALEPSLAMRREALNVGGDDASIRWVGGRAEALPLAAHGCDAAWLSTVVNHIPDLTRCAHELRRALVAQAPVLVRNAFPERDQGITLLRYFPEARRRLASFPSVERVSRDFARAGFSMAEVREVAQTSAASLRDFRVRVAAARQADSLLAALDDDEFARGLARLDDAVRRELSPTPVQDRLTLLVLR